MITVELANQNQEYFEDKVFAVGFTDSVHYSRVPKPLQNVGRNWITSSQPLDTPLKSSTHDVPSFSAGELLIIVFLNEANLTLKEVTDDQVV